MEHAEFDTLIQQIKTLKNQQNYAEALDLIEEALVHEAIIHEEIIHETTAHKATIHDAMSDAAREHQKQNPQFITLIQQKAQCIYQDRERHPGQRLDDALDQLERLGLNRTENSKTLGIAGAIYKRKYLFTGQSRHIDAALNFYLKGNKHSDTSDDYYDGYNAINAAFLLDLKAFNLTKSMTGPGDYSAKIDDFRQQAEQLRRAVIRDVAPPSGEITQAHWWTLVILAEAHLALKNQSDDDVEHLNIARNLLNQLGPLIEVDKTTGQSQVPLWMQDAALRQLAHLYQLHPHLQCQKEQVRDVLSVFFDNEEDTAFDATMEGKMGLALSGGGFRAAFYHLGVLARLAETDTLRKVEVLSCVSGGSIIGARYYQLVRHQLSALAPEVLNAHPKEARALYIDIVKQLRKDLTFVGQQNIRTRILEKPGKVWDMIRQSDYTRTSRLAELYEEHLYNLPTELTEISADTKQLMEVNRQYLEDESNEIDTPDLSDINQGNCILSDLTVQVPGKPNYKPRWDNWKNACKVPILVLNATDLDTGRSWQFTANRMGEAPWSLEPEINSNDHLHWFRYDKGPEKYRNFSLGTAVAASSCVPGLFHPVSLPGLYHDHTVQLVDGGVFDNQGSAALLDEGCNVILVSDACGQLETDPDPSPGMTGSALRSSDVIQNRLRIAQYKELKAKEESGAIHKLMFVHHKSGFKPTRWDVLSEHPEAYHGAPGYARYAIHPEYLEALSRIRTDLDAFSDLEIDALMYSGYQMTKFDPVMAPVLPEDDEDWSFWSITQPTSWQGEPDPKTLALLKNGQNMFLKPFSSVYTIPHLLSSKPKWIAALAIVLMLLLLGMKYLESSWPIAVAAVLAAVVYFGIDWYQKRRKTRKHLARKVKKALLGCVGMVLVIPFRFNLKALTPAFLKSGQRSNLSEDDQT